MTLQEVNTWPIKLIEFLDFNKSLIVDWFIYHNLSARLYDNLHCQLDEILNEFILKDAFHCTRLTEKEISEIRIKGISLSNSELLQKRIDSVYEEGLISAEIRDLIKLNNLAEDEGRRGLIWFMFFPPRNAVQSGIIDLLTLWGGEVLYMNNYENSELKTILKSIGNPCIIRTDVDMKYLNKSSLIPIIFKIYLLKIGFNLPIDGELDYEGYVTSPISPHNIKEILIYPNPLFVELAGCDKWDEQL